MSAATAAFLGSGRRMRATVAPPTTVNRACDWRRNLIQLRTLVPATLASATGRYCCKSLFALLIKNSLGCRRDFRVKMWGTSSPDRKLTGDLGNAIESTEIDGRRSRRPLAGKLSPGDFRLLQQYRGPTRTADLRPGGSAYSDVLCQAPYPRLGRLHAPV
jgi:hypothetical protein